jgi:type II secretory pathway component GspD/PulD (secretin)
LLGILPVIVKADTISNTLTIMGFQASTVDQAEDLIKRLDIPPKQIEVEVRLVELRYDSEDSLGITMNINNILAIDDGSDSGPGLTTSGGSLVLDSQPNSPGGSSLTLATLGRTRVNAILTMLSQFTDLRILTAPKVTVVSGTPGNITLNEIFPFVSSLQNVTQPGGVNAATTQEVEIDEVEVGFTLDVTPTVTGDGHVDMQLNPVISTRGESLVFFDALGNPVQGPPVINERDATVRVRVNDGGTLVIGGLLRRELNHAEGRTPGLGFIPGLAPFFSDKTDTEFTQNLLILVTARVIRED